MIALVVPGPNTMHRARHLVAGLDVLRGRGRLDAVVLLRSGDLGDEAAKWARDRKVSVFKPKVDTKQFGKAALPIAVRQAVKIMGAEIAIAVHPQVYGNRVLTMCRELGCRVLVGKLGRGKRAMRVDWSAE